jgi:Ca2+-binding RTX toxin-like protein
LGAGADSIQLGTGTSESLSITTGADTIGFGTGDDTITTGGSDIFLVSASNHMNGFDSISAAGFAETIRFTSTTPNDSLILTSHISAASLTVAASDAAGVLTGTTPLSIDASALTLGATIFANNGGDSIIGSNHGDTITGGSGADTVALGGTASTIAGGGGGDSITSTGVADNFKYIVNSDSFTNSATTFDANTDKIAAFHDSGPAATIDLTGIGAAGQTFTGSKAFTTNFATTFAADTASQVDYVVNGGNTFVHLTAAGGGYSAGDLIIELQGVHTLTAANFHLH